jgi:hypothetical protein
METVLYTNEILVINKKTWKLNLNSKKSNSTNVPANDGVIFTRRASIKVHNT